MYEGAVVVVIVWIYNNLCSHMYHWCSDLNPAQGEVYNIMW